MNNWTRKNCQSIAEECQRTQTRENSWTFSAGYFDLLPNADTNPVERANWLCVRNGMHCGRACCRASYLILPGSLLRRRFCIVYKRRRSAGPWNLICSATGRSALRKLSNSKPKRQYPVRNLTDQQRWQMKWVIKQPERWEMSCKYLFFVEHVDLTLWT